MRAASGRGILEKSAMVLTPPNDCSDENGRFVLDFRVDENPTGRLMVSSCPAKGPSPAAAAGNSDDDCPRARRILGLSLRAAGDGNCSISLATEYAWREAGRWAAALVFSLVAVEQLIRKLNDRLLAISGNVSATYCRLALA